MYLKPNIYLKVIPGHSKLKISYKILQYFRPSLWPILIVNFYYYFPANEKLQG